jgi:hypothetical protein
LATPFVLPTFIATLHFRATHVRIRRPQRHILAAALAVAAALVQMVEMLQEMVRLALRSFQLGALVARASRHHSLDLL